MDTCQALGGSNKRKQLGSLGDIGTFSLNIFKTITGGDGGCVVKNRNDLYNWVLRIYNQGHTSNCAGIEVGDRSILDLSFRINELTG